MDLLNQFQFPDFSVRPPKVEQWLTVPGSFTTADAVRYKDSGITVFTLGHGAGDVSDFARAFSAATRCACWAPSGRREVVGFEVLRSRGL